MCSLVVGTKRHRSSPRKEKSKEVDNSIQREQHELKPLENKYNSYLRYKLELNLDNEEYIHILRDRTANKCGKFSVPE